MALVSEQAGPPKPDRPVKREQVMTISKHGALSSAKTACGPGGWSKALHSPQTFACALHGPQSATAAKAGENFGYYVAPVLIVLIAVTLTVLIVRWLSRPRVTAAGRQR